MPRLRIWARAKRKRWAPCSSKPCKRKRQDSKRLSHNLEQPSPRLLPLASCHDSWPALFDSYEDTNSKFSAASLLILRFYHSTVRPLDQTSPSHRLVYLPQWCHRLSPSPCWACQLHADTRHYYKITTGLVHAFVWFCLSLLAH